MDAHATVAAARVSRISTSHGLSPLAIPPRMPSVDSALVYNICIALLHREPLCAPGYGGISTPCALGPGAAALPWG